MNMAKYQLERTFFNHSKFNSRDTAASTKFKDVIYKGLFESELKAQGYTNKELDKAVKNNWIKRVYIAPNGMTLRTAYLWLDVEMPQYTPIKRFIDKMYRFVTGEYKRYY